VLVTSGGGAVQLVRLSKSFGPVAAVDGIDLDIPPANSSRYSAHPAAARRRRCG
jgi:hypothetical protein